MARLSLAALVPSLRLKTLSRCWMTRLSKSSPPKWVSPEVAITSKTPLSIVSSDTSKVPPPRSKTRMFFSPDFLSRPYAMAAAACYHGSADPSPTTPHAATLNHPIDPEPRTPLPGCTVIQPRRCGPCYHGSADTSPTTPHAATLNHPIDLLNSKVLGAPPSSLTVTS